MYLKYSAPVTMSIKPMQHSKIIMVKQETTNSILASNEMGMVVDSRYV